MAKTERLPVVYSDGRKSTLLGGPVRLKTMAQMHGDAIVMLMKDYEALRQRVNEHDALERRVRAIESHLVRKQLPVVHSDGRRR